MIKHLKNTHFLILVLGLCASINAQASFNTAANYTADQYTISGAILSPRSVIRDDFGDILVLSQEAGAVVAVYEETNKTVRTAVIIDPNILGLNHGLAYNGGALYASTSAEVLRWGYAAGHRTKITVAPEVVVKNIPSDGDHITRSLIIDRYKFLYVTVGAADNAGESSTRAQIRRFNLAEGIPEGGYEYKNGEVFATGIRNAVGLAIDTSNVLWGADCGADELIRNDLGGDIHNTNPADELLKLNIAGAPSYGFPYCWTVGELEGHQRGDQFAWPDYMNDNVHTDVWCRNITNNRPPTLSLPAHNAPLGLIFYDGEGCDSEPSSFPCSMKGDLFIAFHGSWNREPPSGYKVVRVPIDPNTQSPTGKIEDVIFGTNLASCILNPTKCFRPVDLAFSQKGHLIISSDFSNDIIRVTYKEHRNEPTIPPPEIKKSPNILGLIAISVVGIFTLCLVVVFIRRYCCQESENVPYRRETI